MSNEPTMSRAATHADYWRARAEAADGRLAKLEAWMRLCPSMHIVWAYTKDGVMCAHGSRMSEDMEAPTLAELADKLEVRDE